MTIGVLIPTRGRGEKLAACLRLLSAQDWRPGDEVVVGFDGPDPAGAALAAAAFDSRVCRLRLETMPRAGYIAVRHALVKTLACDVLVSMNDDVLPEPGFIAAHREAASRHGPGVAHVGYSPFVVPDRPTLIDRLVSETSWVFFYDRMLAEPDAGRDWGFRHLWGLNFSASLEAVRRVGGFTAMPEVYGYDDIELGHRLCRSGVSVRFLPEAVARHDHRLSGEDLLRRERALGVSAWHYAARRPAFAREVFRDDITDGLFLRGCAATVAAESGTAGQLRESFALLGTLSGCQSADPALLEVLYRHHLPLKRHCWRQGLLEAASGVGVGATAGGAASVSAA
jgi:GT2 family glycosyltransferase